MLPTPPGPAWRSAGRRGRPAPGRARPLAMPPGVGAEGCGTRNIVLSFERATQGKGRGEKDLIDFLEEPPSTGASHEPTTDRSPKSRADTSRRKTGMRYEPEEPPRRSGSCLVIVRSFHLGPASQKAAPRAAPRTPGAVLSPARIAEDPYFSACLHLASSSIHRGI
jgi:hypothetical protein